MRNITLRAWDGKKMFQIGLIDFALDFGATYWVEDTEGNRTNVKAENITQYTGLKDKNGVEIYESDVMRFSDKWEWYRTSGASIKEIEKLSYEERVVSIPKDYEWLLSSEIQDYWEVIGNIYENPGLQ